MCTEVFHLGCGILNTTTTVWRILFLPIFNRQSLSVKLTGLGTLKDVISGFYISTTRKVSPAQQSSQLPFQWDVTSCGRDSRGVSIPLWHLSGKPHIIWSCGPRNKREERVHVNAWRRQDKRAAREFNWWNTHTPCSANSFKAAVRPKRKDHF